MRALLLVLISMLPLGGYAWGWGYENDPISLAMGKAHTCIPSHYVSHQIDHLAFAKKAMIHSFYQNNYWIPEIGYIGMGFVWPHPYVNTGITASFQGFDAYQEYSIGLSFAHFFQPYVSIALQANYLGFYQAADQKRFHSGTLHLSIRGFPTRSLCLGFSATNLAFSSFQTPYGKLSIPVIFRLGIAYNFNKKVLITFDITKDLEEKARFSFGVDYKVHSLVSIRGGAFVAEGVAPSVGLGFHWKYLQCDIGLMYHFTTGFSSSVGVLFTWPTSH